jgi:hypothetical protein
VSYAAKHGVAIVFIRPPSEHPFAEPRRRIVGIAPDGATLVILENGNATSRVTPGNLGIFERDDNDPNPPQRMMTKSE